MTMLFGIESAAAIAESNAAERLSVGDAARYTRTMLRPIIVPGQKRHLDETFLVPVEQRFNGTVAATPLSQAAAHEASRKSNPSLPPYASHYMLGKVSLISESIAAPYDQSLLLPNTADPYPSIQIPPENQHNLSALPIAPSGHPNLHILPPLGE